MKLVKLKLGESRSCTMAGLISLKAQYFHGALMYLVLYLGLLLVLCLGDVA
jgi:hypothetical protein